MKRLARRIAEWLDPKTYEQARRYRSMRQDVSDLYWYLPDGEGLTVAHWLSDNDFNRNRAIGEAAKGTLPSRIDQFREYLSRDH